MLWIIIEQKNSNFNNDCETETARILHDLANKMESDGLVACKIKDMYGNTIGKMATTPD